MPIPSKCLNCIFFGRENAFTVAKMQKTLTKRKTRKTQFDIGRDILLPTTLWRFLKHDNEENCNIRCRFPVWERPGIQTAFCLGRERKLAFTSISKMHKTLLTREKKTQPKPNVERLQRIHPTPQQQQPFEGWDMATRKAVKHIKQTGWGLKQLLLLLITVEKKNQNYPKSKWAITKANHHRCWDGWRTKAWKFVGFVTLHG